MIYYFSGTGNSRFIAYELAKRLNEECVDITKIEHPELSEGICGFVFPVYSWGVPPIVLRFVRKLRICNGERYIFMVCTCGDDAGLTAKMFRDELKCFGMELQSAFSVQMPNIYVLLPGFDVDSKDVEQHKLTTASTRIDFIAERINKRWCGTDVVRGAMPWLKTKIVYPLFVRFGISPSKWHVTSRCVGCGLCAAHCPVSNIAMTEGKPSWGNNCQSCMACFHVCPHHAVAYGSITTRKGQYRTLLIKNDSRSDPEQTQPK